MDIAGSELVVLSAADDDALVAEIARVLGYIDRVRDVSLPDVAYTCSLMQGAARLAIIATSIADLRARLSSALDRIGSGAKRLRDKSGTYYSRERLIGGDGGGKLAFIYPGVISFYPDMLRDIALQFPVCRAAFDELEEAMNDNAEFTPSNFIFPPAPYYRHDADIFSSGAYAQAFVSVYAASEAMTRLMKTVKLEPNGVVGCAGGDFTAMMRSGAAGELRRYERISAIRDIYRIVDKAVSHGGLPRTVMLSVMLHIPGAADAVVADMPKSKVSLSIEFSPCRRVYAVDPEYEEAAVKAFSNAGIRTIHLALDRPFNTTKSDSLVPAIRKFTDAWMRMEPQLEVYSCGEAGLMPRKIRNARAETAARWAKPVRFAETISKMYDAGYRVFLEVGPRGLMTSAVEDVLKGKEFAAIALDSLNRRGTLQLQHGLAQIATTGVTCDISALFAGRRLRKLDFSSSFSQEVRRDAELRLSRAFPRMTLLGAERRLSGAHYMAEPRGRGAKAAERKAVLQKEAMRNRQFDSGAVQPLISDAEELESSPGVSCELSKVFTTEAEPFMADFAVGSNQVSYADPNLRGLMLLSIPMGVEIAAEAAMRVMPNRSLAAVEDFVCRRRVALKDGRIKLFIRAERIATPEPGAAAIKVKIRDDSPNSAYTWPVMEATVVLTQNVPPPVPFVPSPLTRPRYVHWSGREIYPAMLSCGRRLRGITFAQTWGEVGLDYTVGVMAAHGAVAAAA